MQRRTTLPNSSSAQPLSRIDSPAVSPPTWYEAMGVCALADSERHLGHAVRKGRYWLAYDAVHPDASNTGFKRLGRFKNVSEARQAIESSVDVLTGWLVPAAAQARAFLM
jgi:hypothetical protein